jgi:MOSC domain-containing protein YiiM
MESAGEVTAIHIAPNATDPMEQLDAVTAVRGKGLEGDRYYREEGTFSDHPGGGRDLTLIEAEAIEAIERDNSLSRSFDEHRRNITTRNVPLTHLVDTEFTLGEVTCIGRRLCEPCSHLESLTTDGVLSSLVHRGGLRADIRSTGTINVGDKISTASTRPPRSTAFR